MLSLAHGLHPDIASDEYHKRELGVANKTVLDRVQQSPLHALAWYNGTDDGQTAAMLFGSAFHCALLEPERFRTGYVVEPDFGDCRRTANKAARDAWRAEFGDAIRISEEDAENIRQMVAAVHAHPLAGNMVRNGRPELTARWKDAETGLECKCRTDYYVEAHEMIVDVKTTLDASFEEFRKSISNLGYYRQAGFYTEGMRAIGAPAKHFVFLAVEKVPPYAIATYSLDGEAMGRGVTSVRRDMVTLAECLRTNTWPGYPVGIKEISLLPWAA